MFIVSSVPKPNELSSACIGSYQLKAKVYFIFMCMWGSVYSASHANFVNWLVQPKIPGCPSKKSRVFAPSIFFVCAWYTCFAQLLFHSRKQNQRDGTTTTTKFTTLTSACVRGLWDSLNFSLKGSYNATCIIFCNTEPVAIHFGKTTCDRITELFIQTICSK